MRVLTLGFAGIVVISTALGLLWVTEAREGQRPDSTDRPLP